ncbi:MAG TPA: triphosphoribosyl-dephospho-CoA synthase [Clostridia bacterium]|nr:triphosphoribosyl-dephospho-CoA synthase [Clostridia bacterium]
MSGLTEQIGRFAREALEREARLSPKPGLVDSENSGAHADMDLQLLLTSAEALEPHFSGIAARGVAEVSLSPDGRINAVRELGIAAEAAMFSATNGVNTHKGALFLLGSLSYAAGYCTANGESGPQTVCALAARFCGGVTAELGANAGRAFARYGARGARGEAEDGFPHVLLALAEFSRASEQGTTEQDAWLLALMRLIATMEDANVLVRCGDEIAQTLRERAGEIASRYPAGGTKMQDEIRMLDRDCQTWRASPGGAADVLACAMFLRDLAKIRIESRGTLQPNQL